MTRKEVTARAQVHRHSRSAGLSIAQLHTEHLPAHLDPFLAFDHFQMAQPFFPPHPHAGFSAVTYMFPGSQNGFVNRDTLGERIEIHPGDLHWTAAGRGLMHEEVPITRGVVCHGLQIFVNLPSSKKWMAPQVLHQAAADVPRVTTPGCEVRVVVGQHGAVASTLTPPTAVTLLDVTLEANGRLAHPVPAGERRFLYVIDGEVQVETAGAPLRLGAGEAVGFGEAGDQLVVSASEQRGHVVVAGGRPLREPAIFYGPFCMNTREDILRAVTDYEAGKMGRLEASF
jgi:redox-sensitive bicupin YhaK (pirin superfamily)